MALNPYTKYYCIQAGSGISGYAGSKYQRGNGWFNNLFKKLKPALKYVGKEGLKTLTSIGRDVISGENFSETSQKHLKASGKRVASKAFDEIDKFANKGNPVEQTGTGKRRKRIKKQSKKTTTAKKVKKHKSVAMSKPKNHKSAKSSKRTTKKSLGKRVYKTKKNRVKLNFL